MRNERMIEMIEMEYTNTRIKPLRLATGTHKGFWYYVISMGTHPCAYLDVSALSKSGIDTRLIDCHGGITYSDKRLSTVDREGWFVGWEYAHGLDYNGMVPDCYAGNLKRWTTCEIVEECKNVIEQILKFRGGGR